MLQKCVFSVSTESPPTKFSLCFSAGLSDAQMLHSGGKDSVWATARMEYVVAFQLKEQDYTGSGEVRSAVPLLLCSICVRLPRIALYAADTVDMIGGVTMHVHACARLSQTKDVRCSSPRRPVLVIPWQASLYL